VSVRDVNESHAGASLGDDGHAGVNLGEFVRAAVTDAPDGTRWVGLSEVRAADDYGAASRECEELLAWGARRGATRGYLEVAELDTVTAGLADSLGFRLHHGRRYFEAPLGGWDTV
jgi:hypothetical protein